MKLNLVITYDDGEIHKCYESQAELNEVEPLTVKTLLLWIENGINYKSKEVKENE